MTPFDNTIREIMDFSWPTIFIGTLIFCSIRVMDILKNRKEFVFYKEAFFLIFLIYVLCLFQVVTFEDPTVGLHQNNLVPFREILRYKIGSRLFIKNVLGNFVMFVPYGLFVSIYAKLDKKWQVFLLTIVASISVEVTQFMIGRVFDVDDIILNVCGGMFGYFIYYIICKIGDRLPKFFKSNAILNILTAIMLIFMIYYVWRVVVRV